MIMKLIFFLFCMVITTLVYGNVAEDKIISTILDDTNFEQQQKAIRQLFQAWEENLFQFDDSPANNALIEFCLKEIMEIKWNELSPEKEAQLTEKEKEKLKTAVMLFSLLGFAKIEGQPQAVKFFNDLDKKDQDPEAKMLAAIGKGMIDDAEKASLAKSVNHLLKASPKNQIKMLVEILSDQSYLADPVKDRFISGFAFSSDKESQKLLLHEQNMADQILNDIAVQFSQLSPKKNPGARSGFIELYSRLASTEEAIKWLNLINNPNELSLYEKNQVDSILKRLNELKNLQAPEAL